MEQVIENLFILTAVAVIIYAVIKGVESGKN